jgi:tRNA pseudouridine38-40 synthase
MKNYKIVIEYDGRLFSGWQRQKDKKTVQGEIENALSQIFNQQVRVNGSGRTDAGVHAYGQVANFHAETGMETLSIKKALNSIIKSPVSIRECTVVDDGFHAQYSALSKEYHYFILNREDPCAIGSTFIWHIKKPLDTDLMSQACQFITGVHDFTAFENTGSPRTSNIREVFCAQIIRPNQDKIIFKIRAKGFLKNMVRNLMGTLVFVGLKKISVQEFKAVLDSKDRSRAGPTAPAHGLFLKQVYYNIA